MTSADLIGLIVALVSGAVALTSAGVAFWAQVRVTRLQHDFELERAKLASDEQAKAIISKYREPLVQAAADLQSRLFSIVQLGFLRIYYNKSPADKRYALENTLYVVAEYLGWVEIIRREIQFLDLGSEDESQRLSGLLREIGQIFGTDGIGLNFRLFRGEQRAIGELMTSTSEQNSLERVIGFAKFSLMLQQPDFRRWFTGLEDSLAQLASEPGEHELRLIKLQHAIVDLIDFLDPQSTRIPGKYRAKIDRVREV